MATRTFFLPPDHAGQTDSNAFQEFLRGIEANHDAHFEITGVSEVAITDVSGTETGLGKAFDALRVEQAPAEKLELREGPIAMDDAAAEQRAWDDFIPPIALNNKVLGRSVLTYGGLMKQWALVRPAQTVISVTPDGAGGHLLTGEPGWEWLVPKIVGDDLVVEGPTTWFGGPHDSGDNGQTKSDIVNTRKHPDYMGCALSMNGFPESANTMGSPLPRFKWGTPVEVTCLEGPAAGESLTVTLVDLGPAKKTKKVLDLTEKPFSHFAVPSRGVIQTRYVIRNWLRQIDPHSPAPHIQGIQGRSAEKPAADGVTPFAGPRDVSFEALVQSLRLKHISESLVLEPTGNNQNGVQNVPPPRVLWQNILPTLVVLDGLAESFSGAAVRINSSYRSPEYNRAIGGAALSQHMAFRAIDFSIEGVTPSTIAARLRHMRATPFKMPIVLRGSDLVNPTGANIPLNTGALALVPDPATGETAFEWHGGIGEYAKFVHVDCRGIDAEWA